MIYAGLKPLSWNSQAFSPNCFKWQGSWVRSCKSVGKREPLTLTGYFGRVHGASGFELDLEKRQNLTSRNWREREERQMKEREKHPRAVERGNLKIWLLGLPLGSGTSGSRPAQSQYFLICYLPCLVITIFQWNKVSETTLKTRKYQTNTRYA